MILSHVLKLFSMKPSDIRTGNFMGSVFRNAECEQILHNIVLLQKKTSPDQWIPFSWQQYQDFCTHRVTLSEKTVLDTFVNGGKPVTRSSTHISSGWLNFDGEYYSFSDKMIKMLEKYSYNYVEPPQPSEPEIREYIITIQ